MLDGALEAEQRLPQGDSHLRGQVVPAPREHLRQSQRPGTVLEKNIAGSAGKNMTYETNL